MSPRKMLRVEAGNFVAAALWAKDPEAGWTCIEAAPILSWMKGLDPRRVRDYLLRRGWSWQWLPDVVSDGEVSCSVRSNVSVS